MGQVFSVLDCGQDGVGADGTWGASKRTVRRDG